MRRQTLSILWSVLVLLASLGLAGLTVADVLVREPCCPCEDLP